MISSASKSHGGFTLVEMVVVLGLLALLTHLAIRELSHLQDGRKTQAADAQLENLQRAVYAGAPHAEATGFLADMGRLPQAVDAVHARGSITNATLAELWAPPSAARPYAVRPAALTNLVAGLTTELVDETVLVPTGWRGPYVRLPLGADELLDPWGNPVTTPDMAGQPRLAITNGTILAVSHYGPTATALHPRTVSLVPAGGATSRLILYPVSRGGAVYGEITYRWWGPAAGLITGAVQRVAFPGTVTFTGLTPGRRVVKDSLSGVTRLIDVQPGDNTLEWSLP